MYEHSFNRLITTRFNMAALAALAALFPALFAAPHVEANDLNMHPANCQAPFLDQAFPMRWHELYLMNPASNRATWVICPTTWDQDYVDWPAGGFTSIRIAGAIQSGASADAPLCFFTAADLDNLDLPPYISIPGGKKTFIQNLSTTKTPPTWRSTGYILHDSLRSALGGATTNATRWNVSLLCKLPPGHAISNIYMQQ